MKCVRCKAILPDDSDYCNHCGCRLDDNEITYPCENPSQLHYQKGNMTISADNRGMSNISTDSQQEVRSKQIKLLLIIVAVLIIASVVINRFDKTDSNLTPVKEPSSGQILLGIEDEYGSTITVTASVDHSCVVKLKTSSDVTRLMFYVRADDTVKVKVPREDLYVYFASGDTWYGSNHLFGEETNYMKDKSLCNFREYSMEYTLVSVSNGNFSPKSISEDEFKD